MISSAIPARLALTAALAGLCACGPSADPAPVPVAETAKASPRLVTETVTVRDKDLEQRVSRLELTLLERDAQVEDLQNRLEETRREVVRSMAKVQTLATRAEAASGMAEAEIALQTLRRSSRGSGGGAADVARVSKLLEDATNEFNKQNYGGALYLANQAKSTAGVGRARSSGGDVSSLRPGEVPFAVPLDLQVTARCKLRDGPGTTFRVLATLESGASLSGLSHVDQWVRVSTDSGTTGWVFWNLVQRRADPGNR